MFTIRKEYESVSHKPLRFAWGYENRSGSHEYHPAHGYCGGTGLRGVWDRYKSFGDASYALNYLNGGGEPPDAVVFKGATSHLNFKKVFKELKP